MAQLLEVIVSPSGETTVQTKGYAGSACQRASRWLEQALGLTVSDRKTSEFYQPTTNQEQETRA